MQVLKNKCRIFWEVVVPTKTRKKSNKHGSRNAYFPSSIHLFIVTKNKCPLLSATCTLVYRRRSTWRQFMRLVKGGAQRDVRPWQCIPLPFGNDCANTIFVSSMFIFSVTETDSQPNVASHYGQLYVSQKAATARNCFNRVGPSIF